MAVWILRDTNCWRPSDTEVLPSDTAITPWGIVQLAGPPRATQLATHVVTYGGSICATESMGGGLRPAGGIEQQFLRQQGNSQRWHRTVGPTTYYGHH